MSQCSITFHNNPQAVFYGGQLLSGTAVLTTVKQKTIRAIHVQVKGSTKVFWIEPKIRRGDENDGRNRVRYHGSERHLFKKTYLVSTPPDNDTPISLPAGTHTYNFQIELPEDVPSSFIGKNCNIRYEVIFSVQYPSQGDDIFIKPISVISMFDLNSNPAYKLPIQKDVSRDVFCGLLSSQEIKIRCRIPYSGYAPGQTLPINIFVANNSSVDCYSLVVILTQHVSYSSMYPKVKTRENTYIISERKLDPAFQRRNTDLKTSIRLPALPPSTLLPSGLVDISYLLTIRVRTSGFHRNFEISFPLIIGAIPITELETNSAPVIAIQPAAPVEESTETPPLYQAAIHITINGYAKVRWTERKSRRSGNRTVHYTETYTAHDQYLSSRTYVFGRESGDSIEFPPGIHTYNFQVQLPFGLPSSFNGRHGQIRYDVVLTIDRPWRFNNTFMQPFTVISTLDLNANPVYKRPLEQEQVKEFSCGCCNVQPIRVRCHIAFSGFTPGQKIPITILVQNQSSVNCYASKIKLEKTVRFTATSPYNKSKFETLKVAEKALGAVPRYTNKEFKQILVVPAIPPSSLATCRIIEVSYIMTVKVQTSGCHRNAELVFPITIGTFPLRESATNPANAITVQPTAPPKDGGEAPPFFPPNAIHIEILGHAKVRWTERRSRRKADGKTEYYNVHYTGFEQYLSSRTYVVGNDCGNSFEFQPGRYSYNFQVQLPGRLPSSIEGRYGHVRYEVALTVDRPWRFDNVFKKCFTVIETLNLNLDPIYKQPIYSEDVKTFCCGCCNDEFIKVICRIPFSGYAPGQKVPFSILVENESTVECYNSKIKLEKTVKFTATSPSTKSRYETAKVVEKELGAILKTSKKEFKDFIQLPSIPPSSCNPGHIIDVYYMMTIKVQTSGCHANAELTFPIKIGTIPLLESATNPASVVTIQPTAPQIPGNDGGDAPPPYLGNAPPSYEDATAAEERLTDDEDDKHVKKEPFVPKYPVYYNFASPSAPPSDLVSATAPLLPSEQGPFPSTSSNNQPGSSLPYPTSTTEMPALPSGAEEKQYGWKS